jgi:shikimate dehydrogenase
MWKVEWDAARDMRCSVLNGTGMVIGLAALAFELISGHLANTARMRQSFLSSRGR